MAYKIGKVTGLYASIYFAGISLGGQRRLGKEITSFPLKQVNYRELI